MFTRFAALLGLMMFPQIGASQDVSVAKAALPDQLAKVILEVNLSELSVSDTVRFCLDASEAFHKTGMSARASDYFQLALKSAKPNDVRRHQFVLFDHAVLLADMPTATEIAGLSTQKDAFLDKLAIEEYRRGDDQALKGFPRSKLDFHLALNLADAYAKRGEYKRLERFVVGIESLPANEPTDVGGIAWRKIADEYRKQGKLAEAKRFIDKSVTIAGNNYYTGYGIRVTQLAIQGGLKEQAVKYAERAVAYRGHFTRELLGRLINELVAAGHYEVAKKMIDYYPTDEERMSGERYLAYHLAEQREFDEAIAMARKIKDPILSASARLLVGDELLLARELEEAEALILEAETLLHSLAEPAPEYRWQHLVRSLAKLGHERTMEVVAAGKTPVDCGRRAAAALGAMGGGK